MEPIGTDPVAVAFAAAIQRAILIAVFGIAGTGLGVVVIATMMNGMSREGKGKLLKMGRRFVVGMMCMTALFVFINLVKPLIG